MRIINYKNFFMFITVLSILGIFLSVALLSFIPKVRNNTSGTRHEHDMRNSNIVPDESKHDTIANGADETPDVSPLKKDVQPSVSPGSKPGLKTAYLTFDDGPSIETTPKILDILDSYKIKATFFVIGANALKYSDILKRAYADGQTIGNHTYSHDINYLSTGPNNMVNDFYKGENAIQSIIPGYKSKLARIPGGSLRWKVKYSNAVKAAGFHTVDWNCLTKDAEGANVPAKTLFENFKKDADVYNQLTILMHDSPGKDSTVEVLPEIIEYLKAKSFTFKALN